MELHELHILQGQPCTQHHGIAVASADVRRSTGEISTPIAAGRENGHIRGKTMDRAVIHVECDHAAATALVVHDRSIAKYSTKNSAAWRRACPYIVCSMAWPVRSAAAQVRCAVPLP